MQFVTFLHLMARLYILLIALSAIKQTFKIMQVHISTIIKTVVAGCVIITFASCNSNTNTSTTSTKDSMTTENTQITLKPTMPAPDWAPGIKPEMQVVIEKLVSLGGKPLETLTGAEARMQPTPTDAVMAVMEDIKMMAPASQCDTVGKDIPVTGGTTHVRIYTPRQG